MRLFFAAALVAGLSYIAGWGWQIEPVAAIAWKGAGVGLLAVWASFQGRTTDHRLLATVLALGAIADMVLELNFVIGAGIFAVGHVVAITLYLSNRRPGLKPLDILLAAVFVGCTVYLAAYLAPLEMALPVAAYTLFLTGMAAAAILSHFPLAAAGAMLFVLSDLLIFGRMRLLADATWVSPAIWLTYFGGQALIAFGVAQSLGRRAQAG